MPIMATSLLTNFVGVIDLLIAGHLGKEVISVSPPRATALCDDCHNPYFLSLSLSDLAGMSFFCNPSALSVSLAHRADMHAC